jgi:hypothetical protein
MNVRDVIVRLIAEAAADGKLTARRLIVVDAETGERVQVWPELARPVLSIPISAE